mmetsp:Transcript_25386/g.44630  ORF Transcript_25386/g.44630 Transcript_25386/m.44630 type:complete len:373 (+) Transcript_25386:2626-3744(+)
MNESTFLQAVCMNNEGVSLMTEMEQWRQEELIVALNKLKLSLSMIRSSLVQQLHHRRRELDDESLSESSHALEVEPKSLATMEQAPAQAQVLTSSPLTSWMQEILQLSPCKLYAKAIHVTLNMESTAAFPANLTPSNILEEASFCVIFNLGLLYHLLGMKDDHENQPLNLQQASILPLATMSSSNEKLRVAVDLYSHLIATTRASSNILLLLQVITLNNLGCLQLYRRDYTGARLTFQQLWHLLPVAQDRLVNPMCSAATVSSSELGEESSTGNGCSPTIVEDDCDESSVSSHMQVDDHCEDYANEDRTAIHQSCFCRNERLEDTMMDTTTAASSSFPTHDPSTTRRTTLGGILKADEWGAMRENSLTILSA